MPGSLPTIVYDSNPDALARRVGALRALDPDGGLIATTSRNAVVVLAQAATVGTPALIDLCITDRPSLDRPGERLIERLARGPATSHVRPIAWSAHVGPDVVESVRRAGGQGFVAATLRREREADELRRSLAGEAVWPTGSSADRWEGEWDQWFASAFGGTWQPWMEPILVRLASGDERRSVAADLVGIGAARSENHAAARMREVARLVAGEHSNAPTVVAHRAALVLAQLAARRPLSERPAALSSLAHGADALRAAPSLAVAAGLTAPEVDELLAIDELIRKKRESEPSGAGAPPADRVRTERLWAAGRRAVGHGARVEDVDRVIAGIVARVEGALVALDDAREDADAYPAARAATALVALGEAGLAGADGAVPTWRGRTPAALALADDLPPADLRAFITAADERLAALATDA
jgi:hypothetical protein